VSTIAIRDQSDDRGYNWHGFSYYWIYSDYWKRLGLKTAGINIIKKNL
jgi:hypothetical protein